VCPWFPKYRGHVAPQKKVCPWFPRSVFIFRNKLMLLAFSLKKDPSRCDKETKLVP